MGLRYIETCDHCGRTHELVNMTWGRATRMLAALVDRVLDAREHGIDPQERVVVICPDCEKSPAPPGVTRFT